MASSLLSQYLEECRDLVVSEIRTLLPSNRYGPMLYDLMLDYPLRAAKGLRPALCIAACRALGGRLEDVLRSAVVLELFHNAFLIHDDIEDGSLMRRGLPTLHREYGVPIAINVGDAMLALSLRPLLDNTRVLGLGKALRIMDIVARMALESAEGQALELHWVRSGRWSFRDSDYWHLVYKKTCWYTFIAPMLIGAIVGSTTPDGLGRLKKFATLLGVSFQIQDDLLNLTADEGKYGKEIGGDLWEGKRTLMLMHMMRCASDAERAEAKEILERPQPERSHEGVLRLLELIRRHGSLDYARAFAERVARKADAALAETCAGMKPSVHTEFLNELVQYVVFRDR
jgi:geranylgeranyl diphosphate synthase, type II